MTSAPTKELSAALREKRRAEKLSLRDAATQIGIGSSTLSRIENLESEPDEPTRIRLANWLFEDAPALLKAERIIDVHFRAAKNLDSKTVSCLADVALKIKAQFGEKI